MIICRACDKRYVTKELPHFPKEDYCPECEIVIVETIRETKEEEDLEDGYCS